MHLNNNDLNLNVKCYQNYSYSDIRFWTFFFSKEKCRGHIKGIDYLLKAKETSTVICKRIRDRFNDCYASGAHNPPMCSHLFLPPSVRGSELAWFPHKYICREAARYCNIHKTGMFVRRVKWS